MATFTRFEDIKAWQNARKLTNEIYQLSSRKPFDRDFGLRDQIRRASSSIMCNIAEGYERSGNGEFVYFLGVAKGSAGEVRCQLYIAFDQGYIERKELDDLLQKIVVITRMLSGLIGYLKESLLKGSKYHRREGS